MLITNTRYERIAPNGDRSIVFIKDETDWKYHSDLETKGFKYKEIKLNEPKGGVCISCES